MPAARARYKLFSDDSTRRIHAVKVTSLEKLRDSVKCSLYGTTCVCSRFSSALCTTLLSTLLQRDPVKGTPTDAHIGAFGSDA